MTLVSNVTDPTTNLVTMVVAFQNATQVVAAVNVSTTIPGVVSAAPNYVTNAPSPAPGSPSSSASPAPIIAGVLVGIAVVAGIAFICWRKAQQNKVEQHGGNDREEYKLDQVMLQEPQHHPQSSSSEEQHHHHHHNLTTEELIELPKGDEDEL